MSANDNVFAPAPALPIAAPPTMPPPPAPQPSPEPKYPPRRRANWGMVAEWVAEGVPYDQIAARYGRRPSEIRRQIKRSARLRRLIAEHRAAQSRASAARFIGLKGTVVERLAELIHHRNPRVLLWVADRLRLVDHDVIASLPGALEERLGAMTRRDDHSRRSYAHLDALAKAAREAKDISPVALLDGGAKG